MKLHRSLFHGALVACAAFIAIPRAFAQSIHIDSVSVPMECDTAHVTVYYTASGTFGSKNVFTVQLSASDGSFTPYFQNAGSVKSTTAVPIPVSISHGSHYRVRVAASNPTYIVSGDNGSDITVGSTPSAVYYVSRSFASKEYRTNTAALIGETLYFRPGGMIGLSYAWDFGADATPSTSTDSAVQVTYSTAGPKVVSLKVTNAGECSRTIAHTAVSIFDCDPSIPASARIDSTSGESSDFGSANEAIWVVPGATLTATSGRTIFAEAGSTVTARDVDTVYVKAGAVYQHQSALGGVIIYEPGASLAIPPPPSNPILLQCSSIGYDYSVAPHYSISWAAVQLPVQDEAASIYPNPAANIVTLTSPMGARGITIHNQLGQDVVQFAGPFTTKTLQFDVSRFSCGIYYVTVDFGGRVQTNSFAVNR